MANELTHKSVGTIITQAEYEATDSHVCNSQATGDLIYASSASQLSRLGIGSTGALLTVSGGISAWSTYTITNDGTKTTIQGISGDYWRIGDAGVTNHSLSVEDDVYVSGKFEAKNNTYIDGTFYAYQSVYLMVDDMSLGWGASYDSVVLYETADANAKAMVWGLPHVDEDANNVAVLALVDRDAATTDLGAGGIDLSGITEPTLAIGNEASDAYVSLDAGDVNGTSLGLYFKAAADEDINILKLSVTGTPRMFWNESIDSFEYTKSVSIQDTRSIQTGGQDDDWFSFKATDDDGAAEALLEVARVQSGNDPFFSAGGSQEFKFYNSGYASFTGYTSTTSYHEWTEMAAPGAGAANTARIYALEGAGDALTDLCAVFQDGTVDVFAQESTEPDSPIFQFPDNTELKVVMRKPDNRTIRFVGTFPDGREYVMREIRYPEDRW